MPAHYRTRTVVALASIATAIISPSVQTFAAQDASSTNHWNMTYHAGAAPISPKSKIAVNIEGHQIAIVTKTGSEFAIPLDEITAVSSSVTGHYGRVSSAEAKFAESLAPRCGPGPDVVCAATVITTWLLIVPSYPIKTTDRLVQIVWRDRNSDEEIVLSVHKSDFEPFLAQLEKGTAKPWKNLDTEWAKVQQELKNAESSKVQIRLERKVKIAKSDLEPGPYQIVLLERQPNQGELYFFPGTEVDLERLAGIARVEILPSESGSDSTDISYKQDAAGETVISSIQTSSRIYRFP